jgi:hypothetical protein
MPFFLALIPIAVEVVEAVQLAVGVAAVATTAYAGARVVENTVDMVNDLTSSGSTSTAEQKTIYD